LLAQVHSVPLARPAASAADQPVDCDQTPYKRLALTVTGGYHAPADFVAQDYRRHAVRKQVGLTRAQEHRPVKEFLGVRPTNTAGEHLQLDLAGCLWWYGGSI
jgi:hypothetical protein